MLTYIGAILREKNIYVIKPIMDKKEVIIKLTKVDYYIAPTKLDEKGWSSIAFWTNDIEKDYNRLISAGVDVYPISSLVINNKPIKLFWATNGEGLIIEFLGVDINGRLDIASDNS